jgi:uncharacterized protein YjbI with pentapeptide repeats
MANQEHLDILKQGVEVWNEWRAKNPRVQIDLKDATFYGADLNGADLSDAYLNDAYLIDATLSSAHLRGAHLRGATLSGADLGGANLSGANLSKADLIGATLSGTTLSGTHLSHANLLAANLSDARLVGTDLSDANLSNAFLRGADLSHVHLSGANLSGVNLSDIRLALTVFGAVDLSTVRGLETIKHLGPSSIGIDTIYLSNGNIPEAFLKGAGVDDTFISYILSLVGKAIEYYSCFISYSNTDKAFAKRLYADLQNNNVRCWFAPEDMKIGDKIRPRINESIRIYDKLLLILSENSVASTWVEFEVEAAMDKEQEGKPPVLFPVRLDNTVMESTTAWAAYIKRTRNIGDFTNWKNLDDYEKAFNRLLRDLKAET